MTKGIREYTNQRFQRHLPKAAELGPTEFRRKVMNEVQKQFDITVASAATAYNFVLKTMREQDPKAVAGIGRVAAMAAPMKATGARASARTAQASPKGDVVDVVKAKDGEVVATLARTYAEDLVAASAGRRGPGRSKLVIKEEETDE